MELGVVPVVGEVPEISGALALWMHEARIYVGFWTRSLAPIEVLNRT